MMCLYLRRKGKRKSVQHSKVSPVSCKEDLQHQLVCIGIPSDAWTTPEPPEVLERVHDQSMQTEEVTTECIELEEARNQLQHLREEMLAWQREVDKARIR